MKVLIFSLSYHPLIGGAEVAVKEITDRISPEEMEFEMVTLRFSKAHPKVERIGNITVHRLGGGLSYLSKVLFIPQAVLFAMRRNYDQYWAMMTYMLFPIVILRLMGKRVPYVLTLQDGDPFEHVFQRTRISLFRPLLSYGFRHAKKIQTISHFLAQWAKKLGFEGRVEVIPNGVELKRFESPNDRRSGREEVMLVTTSRLVEKNGVGDIIEALEFLPENVKLKIVGTGPLEQKLKEKAQELGVSNRVVFTGEASQKEIPRHLHESDIFIRPSLSEGQGISFIEAMAAGLPVIATPVGGIVDFLKDGETGIFCRPHDSGSIVQAVKRLMGDLALQKKVKEKALQMVKEKYDWDLIAREMKGKVFAI